MSDEKRVLRQINDRDYGHRVAMAFDVFAELIAKRRKASYEALSQAFRSGKGTQEVYNAVAALIALDDFENEVKKQTRVGEKAGKELLDGGPGQ